MTRLQVLALAASGAILAGCGEDTTIVSTPSATRGGSPEAEAACVQQLSTETGTVPTVLSSELTTGGTLVTMETTQGGPVWRCLASNEGEIEDLSA